MVTPKTQIYSKIDRVFYYTDGTAITQVGPSIKKVLGNNIGQKSAPSRGIGKLVGTTTGQAQTNSSGEVMLEVDWTNRYWVTGSAFKKGYYENESKTSWVKNSQVSYTVPFTGSTSVPDSIDETGNGIALGSTTSALTNNLVPNSGTTGSGSSNTTTYIIVGAVLVVLGALFLLLRSPKKKSK